MLVGSGEGWRREGRGRGVEGCTTLARHAYVPLAVIIYGLDVMRIVEEEEEALVAGQDLEGRGLYNFGKWCSVCLAVIIYGLDVMRIVEEEEEALVAGQDLEGRGLYNFGKRCSVCLAVIIYGLDVMRIAEEEGGGFSSGPRLVCLCVSLVLWPVLLVWSEDSGGEKVGCTTWAGHV